jgi:hypothetical protein
MMNIPTNVLLGRISRWSAWVSFVVVLLFIVTGYGMTKQMIDPTLAKFLHAKVLPIPLFLALVVHGGICARDSLRRWKVFKSDAAADLYVAAFSVFLLGFFVWLYVR